MSPTRCKIHKYRRYRRNPSEPKDKPLTYHCINCTHYVRGREFILNRETLCWRCNTVFKINENTLQLKPLCGCQLKAPKTPEQEELLDKLIDKVIK